MQAAGSDPGPSAGLKGPLTCPAMRRYQETFGRSGAYSRRGARMLTMPTNSCLRLGAQGREDLVGFLRYLGSFVHAALLAQDASPLCAGPGDFQPVLLFV